MEDQLGGWVLLAVIVLMIAAWYYRKPWEGSGWVHGTASFAGDDRLKQAGMLGDQGLVLGRSKESGQLIRMPGFQNAAVFAPTGAGKGVSLVIPWLLDPAGRDMSVVCFDPKGENYKITADARRRMGQRVVVLDPFNVSGGKTDSFNPLDLIGDDPGCVDDAKAFAEAMVIRSSEGDRDPHFNDQAANVLAGLLALVAAKLSGPDRNLSAVRELVTDPGVKPDQDGKGGKPDGIAGGALVLRALGKPFDRLAGVMQSLVDRERASVVSTVNRHTTFLDSLAICAATERSSFNVRELLKGNTTLYVILPAHQLEAQARWLRLVFSAVVRMVGRDRIAKGKGMLMLLDEFGQMGHTPAVDQALTLMRGYGLRCAFFLQSLTQLKEVFREKEGLLLDNADAQIYFGTQSLETAERVSRMLGSCSVTVETGANEQGSESYQRGGVDAGMRGVQVSRSTTVNRAEVARELMKTEEILQMSQGDLLAFVRGVEPIRCKRVKYYSDPVFSKLLRGPVSPLVWLLLVAGAAALTYALANVQ